MSATDASSTAATAAFPRIVHLNVGGVRFTTSLQTLTLHADSMLGAMFSGRVGVEREADGSYFIDRDPTHFQLILNFLRDGRLVLPDNFSCYSQLLAEANFYALMPLADMITAITPAPPPETLTKDGYLVATCSFLDPGPKYWWAHYGEPAVPDDLFFDISKEPDDYGRYPGCKVERMIERLVGLGWRLVTHNALPAVVVEGYSRREERHWLLFTKTAIVHVTPPAIED